MDRLIEIADHWQAALAGMLGFAAAILAVFMTLRAERRKSAAEDRTFRHALGAEVRQFGLLAYEALIRLQRPNITIQMIEDAARFPSPAIYASNGHRIGSLGDHDAQQVVYFYGQIDILVSAIARMRRDFPRGAPVGRAEIQGLSDALLDACNAAIGLLPPLSAGKTENPNDATFREAAEAYKVKQQPLRGLEK
jgi:hypothetical protein